MTRPSVCLTAAAAIVSAFGLLVPAAAAAATITVNAAGDSVANDGFCTLREAIIAANNDAASGAAAGECGAGSGADAIHFAIPGSGPFVIAVGSALPTISQPLQIDGYSQPGAVVNSSAQGTNAVLPVRIDGGGSLEAAGLGFQANGSVRGLQITRFQVGVAVFLGQVTVAGNFIGTDGVSDLGNFLKGVVVQDNSCVVGGATNADRNLISGNDNVAIETSSASSTTIRNNLINTDRSGEAAIPGGLGIVVGGGGFFNQIVGNVVGASDTGITLTDDINQSLLTANWIGISPAGANLGGSGWGVSLIAFNGSPDLTTIGGLAAGEGNTIGNWGSGGILVDRLLASEEPQGNRFLGNSIYGNGFGIDLLDDQFGAGSPGVNPNDPGDGDLGANDLQNWPVLASARWDGTSLRADLSFDSTANATYRLEFFESPSCGGSNGEGQTFLGAVDVTLDASGVATLTDQLITTSQATGVLTATATHSSRNNTSEFSNCIPIAIAAVDVPVLSLSSQLLLVGLLALCGALLLRLK